MKTITIFARLARISIIFAVLFSLAGTSLPRVAQAAFGDLSVSQTNVFVNVGQTATVNLFVPSNQVANLVSVTNTNVANAWVSGNTLTVQGISSGNSQIGVCSTNQQCAYINVTVSGFNNPNQNGLITFSQSSVVLNVGQSISVSIFNNFNQFNNSYYISSNSNNSIVSASISGNTLNLLGLTAGSTSIVVCNSFNSTNCGTLFVTVNGNMSGNVVLSQNTITMTIGQSAFITAYNSTGGNFLNSVYIASNTNSSVAFAAVNSGNQIGINAVGFGTTSINICSNLSGQFNNQCATLVVTVNSNNNNNCFYPFTNCNNSGTGILFLQNANPTEATIFQFYTYSLQVTGGVAPYTFTLNSGALPPGLTLSTNGVISGTPSVSGTYIFTVRVVDAFNRVITSGSIYLVVASNNSNFSNCYFLSGYYTCAPRNPGSVAGAALFNNGTLIKENNTIYIVYKNTRSGFANFPAFTGLGYKLQNVLFVSNTGLFDSGRVIRSENEAHPWGSWIKSGTTVYFVHDSGLIPISAYDVFLNNSGQDALVVPANIYDFSKQVLSPMVFNDSRLK